MEETDAERLEQASAAPSPRLGFYLKQWMLEHTKLTSKIESVETGISSKRP